MVRKYTPLIVSAVIVLLLSSCAFIPVRTEPLGSNSKFESIVVSNNIELIYTPGPNVKYSVEASLEATKRVRMEVRGSSLSLSTRNVDGKVKITLTSPSVSMIVANNNASVTVTGPLAVKDFTAAANNNSSIKFTSPFDATELTVTASGLASVDFSSLKADDFIVSASNLSTVTAAGSGKEVIFTSMNNVSINAGAYRAFSGVATASGNSTIKICVDDPQTTVTGNATIENLL